MPLSDISDSTLRNLLQQFCETSFHSILITSADPGYPIVYANPSFCTMTGYQRAELIGKSPKILQGEKTNPKVLQRLKNSVESGTSFHGSAINYRKNGDSYPVEWNITTIRDDAEKIIYYISIQKDLTQFKNIMSLLKSSNEHFKNFLLDISKEGFNDSKSEEKKKSITEEILNNSRLYNPSLRSEKNIELFEDTEFFDSTNDTNGILAEPNNFEPLSASEYNTKYNLKMDILDLNNRIRETLENVDMLAYSKNPEADLITISQNLKDIANDIFYFDEFFELSSTLTELANQSSQCDLQKLEPFVIDTFRALVLDLETWLKEMFIEKSASNIHALDNSIISSSKQLLYFLK